MSVTVTEHTDGHFWLYENEEEGKTLEVNAQDHFLIERGKAAIEWQTPEVVIVDPNGFNELLDRQRLKRVSSWAYSYKEEK